MEKIKIGIFVEGTFLPSFEGATQRFASMAENLSLLDFDVTILHCYRGWSDKKIIKEQLFTTYFIPPAIFYNDIKTIERIVLTENIEVVIISNYEMIMQIGYPLKRLQPNIKLIFEVHDITYDYNKSFKPDDKKNEIEKRFEYLAFHISDLCICFSPFDSQRVVDILKEFGQVETEYFYKTIVIPFGITHNKTRFVGPNLNAKNIVFLGSMYHTPNLVALKEIFHKIIPVIQEHDTTINFIIAGETPAGIQKELYHSQMKFLGKVENLETVFSNSTLAIAPIFYGSGLKVKVLEYCQAGMPILCSSQSLRGIIIDNEDKRDFEIEDNIDNYGVRIINILDKPERLLQMSLNTRKYIIQHSWTNISTLLKTAISNCIVQHSIKLSTQDTRSLKNLNPYFLEYYHRLKRFKNIKTKNIYKGGFGHLIQLNLLK